jgi:hypothetical protein
VVLVDWTATVPVERQDVLALINRHYGMEKTACRLWFPIELWVSLLEEVVKRFVIFKREVDAM